MRRSTLSRAVCCSGVDRKTIIFCCNFPLREFANGCHQCAALAARCPTISALGNPSEGEVSIHARDHFFSILCSPPSFVTYTSSPPVANSSMHDQELQPVSKKSVAIKDNGATQHSSLDRDRADLIRLGKKPVLRVGLVKAVSFLWETDMLYSLAEFRVHVDAGFQLHPTFHLGSNLEVCIADLSEERQ